MHIYANMLSLKSGISALGEIPNHTTPTQCNEKQAQRPLTKLEMIQSKTK